MGGAIDKLLYALRNNKVVNPYTLYMSIFGNVDDMNKFRHAIHSYEEGRYEYPERYEEAAQKMLDAIYKNESRIGRNNKNTTVRLNEGQLHSLISESVGRVLTEIGYHEKQKRDQSKDEHDEWVMRMSKYKKAYYNSKKKDDDDSDSVDYKAYKGGKGNFKPMKSGKLVKEGFGKLPKNYDAWRTREPDYLDRQATMISEDDFMSTFYSYSKDELMDWLKNFAPDVYEEALFAEKNGTENPFNVAYERLGWKEIAREFLDMQPVLYYPGDRELDESISRNIKKVLREMMLPDEGCSEESKNDEYKPKFVWVDSRVKGVGSSWYYGGCDEMSLDELQSFLDKYDAVAEYNDEFYKNVYEIPFKPEKHSVDTYGMPTGRYIESEPRVVVVPNGTKWDECVYSYSKRFKFPDGFRNDFDHKNEQIPERNWRKNK